VYRRKRAILIKGTGYPLGGEEKPEVRRKREWSIKAYKARKRKRGKVECRSIHDKERSATRFIVVADEKGKGKNLPW